MKTLYAVPSYKCNLACPHCNVRNKEVEFNFGKFLEALRTTDAENVILFGGEPTLIWDLFEAAIMTGKVTSVSTNLMVYSVDTYYTKFANLLRKYNVSVATSWNYERFKSINEVGIWLSNVKALVEEYVDVLVLITLTKPLIDAPFEDIVKFFTALEKTGVKQFLFEPYIGDIECNREADEWLCGFHRAYKGKMTNLIEKKLDNWKCDCSDTYTLEPNGDIVKGCPDSLVLKNRSYFLEECIDCNHVENCQPCNLEKTCSYPKKLAELIKNESL